MPPDQQCEPAAAEEAEESSAVQDTQTNTARDSEAFSITQDAESSEAAARTKQEDEQLQHSPQRSPSEVGASYVRLWTAVFGEPAAPHREGEEKRGGDTPRSAQTTPTGVTKQYLRLWTEVFGECSAADHCESHSAGQDRDSDSAAEDTTPHSVTEGADAITRCRRPQPDIAQRAKEESTRLLTNLSSFLPRTLLPVGRREGPDRLEVVRQSLRREQHGEGDEEAHRSPQVSRSQVGVRYARLWTEVFGEE